MLDLLTLNNHIEIILTKIDDKYRATSPSFPRCKGIAESKKEAISKLTRSISNHIARKAKKQLDTILSSKSYSEVITNPKPENTDQHLVFNLIEDQSTAKQEVFFKLDDLQSFLQTNSPFQTKEKEDVISTGSTISIDPPSTMNTPLNTPLSELSGPDKNLLYGIQFSLN